MKVAIQLYSVRNSMAKDAMGTMKLVADIGYKYWETCELFDADIENNYGLAGLPAKEAKIFLADNGVKVIGCHISIEQMQKQDELERFLEYQAAVDCWSPGLAIDFWANEDELKRKCELYNRVGEKCKKLGMMFHYHNHFHEFQKFGDNYVWDLLCQYTDPELVKLEIDTFWAARGGADPVEVIKKYGDRVIMLHQKDFPADASQKLNLFDGVYGFDDTITIKDYHGVAQDTFVEVGTGVLPIQSYIDAANASKVKYITLEQDYTKYDEIDSIRLSMENFNKFSGVEWA